MLPLKIFATVLINEGVREAFRAYREGKVKKEQKRARKKAVKRAEKAGAAPLYGIPSMLLKVPEDVVNTEAPVKQRKPDKKHDTKPLTGEQLAYLCEQYLLVLEDAYNGKPMQERYTQRKMTEKLNRIFGTDKHYTTFVALARKHLEATKHA